MRKLITLMALIVFFIISGCVLLPSKNKVTDQNKIQNSMQTDEWLTFVSNTPSYSIRYPQNWKYEDQKYKFNGSESYSSLIYFGDKNGFPDIPISIAVENMPLKQYADQKRALFNDTAKWLNGFTYTEENISVNGNQGLKFTLNKSESFAGKIVYILFGSNNETIDITYTALSDESVFNKMVNTFTYTFVPGQTIKNTKNIIQLSTAKVGDKVGSMTIQSIEPFTNSIAGRPKDLRITTDNVSIIFVGKVTIAGTYHYYGDDQAFFGNTVCFDNLDEDSKNKIPVLSEDSRSIWFCFENDVFAKEKLGPKGSTGKAIVEIDKYTLNAFPAEVWNTAELIRVLAMPDPID